MTLREFIRQNRGQIDNFVASPEGNVPKPTNDEERRLWVLNDEGLYNWARREGCRI